MRDNLFMKNGAGGSVLSSHCHRSAQRTSKNTSIGTFMTCISFPTFLPFGLLPLVFTTVYGIDLTVKTQDDT